MMFYTTYAERKETGSDKRENEASLALFARVRNMAAHGSVSSRLSQSLTEEDIPGASLQGRNPTALKTDELRFWLKCRGDPAKGLKTQVQLRRKQVNKQPQKNGRLKGNFGIQHLISTQL